MEDFPIRRWEPILAGVRWLYVRQQGSDRLVEVGFLHRAGRFRHGGSPFSFPERRSCSSMERVLIHGWTLPSLGGAGFTFEPQPISDRPAGLVFPHRAGNFDGGYNRFRHLVVGFVDVRRDFCSGDVTLSFLGGANSIFVAQPINDRTAGLGFPHRAGRFRPGGSPFPSSGCRSYRCIEGFSNRGWRPILPGCGEIARFSRGATPATRASLPHWPRAGGGWCLGQWDRASKNPGMKVICLI